MSKPVNCGCGGKVCIETDHDTIQPIKPIDWKRVRCNKCNIRTTWRHSEAEAVEAWNEAMGADKNSVISVFPAELMDTTIVQKINSVTPVKIEYYNEDSLYASGHICPNCHTNVIVKYKYCPECGMKLDWSNCE